MLRKGKVAFQAVTAETSARELARQMVGRDVSLSEEGAALGMIVVDPTTKAGEPARAASGAVLEVTGLCVRAEGAQTLDQIDLRVRPGEIVALYGVEGSGQSTLGDVFSGLLVPASGTIAVDGMPLDLRRPGAMHRGGIGIIPEDRHKSGVALDMSIAENMFLKSLGDVSGRGFLRRSEMRAKAQVLAEEFNVIAPSVDVPLRSLSGGNQQRVVLARELSAKPRVLVAAQPTHGLDVGAIEDMYVRLRDAAATGVGILLISTELEEVMALASWITVISSGRVVGTMPVGEATAERLGMMVGGEAA
ncbi:ATP-binding cassette domain-containing protein [Aeromicrobium sp. UC242_57]|uniref:ATP-binding cassette domain-containing protein n=1 Tax=Aeromicrobium sp. UC242_57 TaxID=3374624 RepID=UPI0037B7C336